MLLLGARQFRKKLNSADNTLLWFRQKQSFVIPFNFWTSFNSSAYLLYLFFKIPFNLKDLVRAKEGFYVSWHLLT